MKRVEGYMTRAEQLRTMLHKTIPKSDGTAELQKYPCVHNVVIAFGWFTYWRGEKGEEEENDAELAKLRNSVACT